jgi:hypothetical protein
MFEDFETIRVAAQMLAVRYDERPQRLLDAAAELWSEMYDIGQWPDELVQHAAELAALLTARGDIESTVPAMDEPTLKATGEKILEFVRAMEASRPAVC